jgi:glutamyl-tRNA synthetase
MTNATDRPANRPVRVRFAPSPTGDLHVGAMRTALWTWLYARHTGGAFILRIEDTDQTRFAEGTTEGIERSLEWLGVDWDEGPIVGGPFAPYFQSERKELYQQAADRLLASGHAYRCFATAEELREMREAQQARNEPPRYDGRYRDYPVDQAEQRAAAGEPHVIRFKMPLDGATTFTDLLRGDISFENKELDDFVILKSDGFPTYHLAHVVDDTAMEISHVTRAEEWIPSTPRHVQLFQALGYREPIWVHYPVILGPDGGKLSKRHGAKFVLEYAEEGYLPDALLNFLAITGWALDDHTEIFSRERLIEVFDVADISKNPSGFDTTKLEWMNGVYMRELPEEQLVDTFRRRLEHDLPPDVPRPLDAALIEAFTPIVRERLKLLSELAPLVEFFFRSDVPTPPADEFLVKKWRDRGPDAAAALTAVARSLDPVDPWQTEPIEAAMRAAAEQLDLRAGDLFSLVRLAVTGARISPPLFESMEIVGKGLSLERIEAASTALATS